MTESLCCRQKLAQPYKSIKKKKTSKKQKRTKKPCELCEYMKHTFHLSVICCIYTHSFPESAVESRLLDMKRDVFRKQKKKNSKVLYDQE